tara:strand:+ start:178 stop:375 length:198 start_codon:yes stop_codon:yes gene_type:complete
MENKVQIYDAVSGEVYSVPIEGFATSDGVAVDKEEAAAWLKKHNCKYEYDEDGDIAVSDITWQVN